MVDITAPDGRIATFQKGAAEPACIDIRVVNDEEFEGNHQFIVTLTNPTPSTVMIDPDNNKITVTITDADGMSNHVLIIFSSKLKYQYLSFRCNSYFK